MYRTVFTALTALCISCGSLLGPNNDDRKPVGDAQKLAGTWTYQATVDGEHRKYYWTFRNDTLLKNYEFQAGGFPSFSAKLMHFWRLDADTLKQWKPQHCITHLGGARVCDPVDTVKYHASFNTTGQLCLAWNDSTLVMTRSQ